ncbi:PREDICTED: alkylated DNA repair protein alkB homolog 8-like isoform X2 [Priapulus caudatus]|uniref:tRNA (carboxymethyluridine(34)-5-O)-methyltransferase n=1 Tax=Priapulus caudatus TaxID=37621 RepID=A0ABM1E407_PRICU|nr:PREDICTED: alkylated DNA repair protein alkB homolog 8-like isoform X2 [Priapulus caudatus]
MYVFVSYKHLFVANGGLVCGVSKEQLLEIFQPYGEVSNVVMVPDKPHAFISYVDVGGATRAVACAQGYDIRSSGAPGAKLHLLYVEKLPDVISPSNDGMVLPPGLILVHDIISEDYERELLAAICWEEDFSTQKAQNSLRHRQVKHFGYEFRYDNNNVDKDSPLEQPVPAACCCVLDTLRNLGHLHQEPDQLTVNQYLPGQGIPPHVDTHSAFEDQLVSLSLGSAAMMEFRRDDGRHLPVVLPRRSAIVMTGESRYLWTHGITPRKTDVVPTESGRGLTLQPRGLRTSFTFRKVRRTPCDCGYPDQCDSQRSASRVATDNTEDEALSKSNQEAAELECAHVHQVYEEIAGHFSGTRHRQWPQVAEFLASQPRGSLMLDVGSGNGKYLAGSEHLVKVGCDRSGNLNEISRRRGHEVFGCDCLRVAVRAATIDVCLSIAVIHHLSTRERRLAAIEELMRVLTPGGKALIYVWAMEQERGEQAKSSYIKKKNAREGERPGVRSGPGTTDAASVNRREPTTSCDGMVGETVTGNTGDATMRRRSTDGHPGDDGGSDEVPRKLPVHVNRTNFKHQDVLVPWHLRGGRPPPVAPGNDNDEQTPPVFHRFYHVFRQGELEALCASVSCARTVRSFHDNGNWCVVLEKTREDSPPL